MNSIRVMTIIMISVMVTAFGCMSTVSQSGKDFSFKEGLVIDKTTKRSVLENYGHPSSSLVRGKYEILNYRYGKQSLKHGRAIGMGALSAVPIIGVATLAMDQGVKDSDIATEYKNLTIYVELASGLVRDFYYHDSEMKGHDESETMFLKAIQLLKQGKNDEAIKALEESIAANPKNHRALNLLGWTLIDLNIDVERGVAYAEKAVFIFPESPYNNGTLGCGYYKKAELEKAEQYLTTATKLFQVYAPEDQRALTHDQAVLQAVRDKKK